MLCVKKHLFENTRNFDLICSLKFESTIPVYMYRSVNSGITVCIAEVDGPIINGYFNIATETFDDDGLPYALSRLIFAGTEEYPDFHNLNFLASRALGSNISSCCLQDRTYYTMSAAGSEAFLTLMPIYLNHILYPTLKDSAYLLDVHHVTKKGNAGILYCITQIKERTTHHFLMTKMFRALFPGNCGYNSNIQGTTKNLRESTNNDKVKQFHQKFYRPENLTILITGKIQHNTIFQALLPLEQKIMSQKRKDIFKKPWQTPIEQLKESVDVDVAFPFTKETYGSVYVAWRGPSPITQLYHYRGCLLLLRYLTRTSSSPLMTEVVQKNNLFFTCIQCFTLVWSVSVLHISFTNVPVKKIDLISKQSLQEIFSNLYSNGINMKTVRTLIHGLITHCQLTLEKNPHEDIASVVFDHIVHGNTKTLDQRLNYICDLKKLIVEPEEYFLNLFKTYFIDAPMVVVKGKPSLDEYIKLQEEEKKHITEKITKLSKKCLLQKEQELQQAVQKHLKCVSSELLAKVPIPGIDSITFCHIKRYNTTTFEQHSKLDVKKLPFFTYLDHVNTNFSYLQVIMDTSYINAKYSTYIPLLMKIIIESPVTIDRSDQLILNEEIKHSFQAIKFKCHDGINTAKNYSQSISLMFQVELQNYGKAVQWCKELLYDSKVTVEKLKLALTRLLNELAILRPDNLVKTLINILLYRKDSIRFTCNLLLQHAFFSHIKKRLNTYAEQEKVIAEINNVRKILISPKNMFVHMAVNVDKLTERVPDVYEPWNKFFSDFVTSEKTKPNITADWELLKPFDKLIYNGFIMGLEDIDSTFFIQTCLCINNVQYSDFAALSVCLKYFTQPGGLMCKEIINKATNLKFASANDSLYLSPDEGLLYMELFHTNILSTYEYLKLIIETYDDGIKWNQYLYESAKSLAILDFINEVRTKRRMIKLSLKCYCRNVSYDDYVHQTIRHMSAVTMTDLSRVLALYVKPLFDPKKCKTAIVCNISKVAEIEDAFHRMNFSLKVYKSLEDLSTYVKNVAYR